MFFKMIKKCIKKMKHIRHIKIYSFQPTKNKNTLPLADFAKIAVENHTFLKNSDVTPTSADMCIQILDECLLSFIKLLWRHRKIIAQKSEFTSRYIQCVTCLLNCEPIWQLCRIDRNEKPYLLISNTVYVKTESFGKNRKVGHTTESFKIP